MKYMDSELGLSPAHNNEEPDEEQGVWAAAIVLGRMIEVQRTAP